MNSLIVLFACFIAVTVGQAVQQQSAVQAPAAQSASAAAPATSAQVSTGAEPTARGYFTGFVARPNYTPGYVGPVQTPLQPNYVNQGQVQTNYANQGQAQAAQTLSAVDASRQLIAAAIAQGANANNFGVQTTARYTISQQPNVQVPDVFTALDSLRGRASLTIDEILNILASAVAGRDYPYFNDIPNTRFTCESVKQAGFYADTEASCQVIRRCDINGVMWSYLCPNMTIFNQITLVCDWFFNVNCASSTQYYDYSNPRLYTQFALLDTPASIYAGRPTPTYITAPAPTYGPRPNPSYVLPGNTYQG